MIQNIFLPEKFGTYYLFSQRMVGINITKAHLYVTIVVARGSRITIEKSMVEPLVGERSDPTERVIEAIKKVMKKIGTVGSVRIALSANMVVFKELRLPFDEYDKLNKIVRFEVEPLLPFPVQDAIIDFIITGTSKGSGSQVLVAAAQKQTIAEQLSLFEQAGIDPAVITVDAFCLYALYNQIPAYKALQGTAIIIDLDLPFTKILIIHNDQLRIIRTLPHGIAQIAKSASESLKMSVPLVMDHLIRFGLEKSEPPEIVQTLQKSFADFWNKTQFAINSALNQLNENKITKIMLTGTGAEIKGISAFVQEKAQSPCELFDIKKLTENPQYIIASKMEIPQAGIGSVGAALPNPVTRYFNLRRGAFEQINTILLLKQLITAGVLFIFLFVVLITHSIIQISKLNTEIKTLQQETVEQLKNRFIAIPEEEDDLEDVLQQANEQLTKEENIWLAFSSQTRASFLEYLLELTTRINKQELGFIPEQIIINDGAKGEVTVTGQVRDYEALKLLEQSLSKSKIFSYEEGPKTPKFSLKMHIRRMREL